MIAWLVHHALSVLSAVLAGVAAWLAVRSPPALLRRTVAAGPGSSSTVWPGPRSRWAARPDAPSLARRVVVGAVAGLGVLGAGSALLGSFTAPTVAAGAVWIGSVVLLGRVEPTATRRRRERLVLDLPQALDLLAAAIGGGLPLRAATGRVARVLDGPLADDLREVLIELELGSDESTAWRRLAQHPQLGRVAADLARSADSGTMVAHTLRQHAADARRLRRAALEARARTVGVRSVLPLMTCFLPAFFLIGIVPTVVSAMIAALS